MPYGAGIILLESKSTADVLAAFHNWLAHISPNYRFLYSLQVSGWIPRFREQGDLKRDVASRFSKHVSVQRVAGQRVVGQRGRYSFGVWFRCGDCSFVEMAGATALHDR